MTQLLPGTQVHIVIMPQLRGEPAIFKQSFSVSLERQLQEIDFPSSTLRWILNLMHHYIKRDMLKKVILS